MIGTLNRRLIVIDEKAFHSLALMPWEVNLSGWASFPYWANENNNVEQPQMNVELFQ